MKSLEIDVRQQPEHSGSGKTRKRNGGDIEGGKKNDEVQTAHVRLYSFTQSREKPRQENLSAILMLEPQY